MQNHFEPSPNTKALLKFTRKALYRIDAIVLPGLFQTARKEIDTTLFTLVLLLEGYGLFNLWNIGQANPLFVAALFSIDLVLAVLKHLQEGPACELRNRLVFTPDRATQARLQHQLRRRRAVGHVFSSLIVAMAIAKILGLVGLVDGQINAPVISVVVAYAVTAWLHVAVTGSFLFGVFAEVQRWLDWRAYLADADGGGFAVQSFRRWQFETPVPIVSAAADRHTLTVAPEGSMYRCELRTWGILADHHLHTLINAQPTIDARTVVGREGVRHQVTDILPTNVQQPAFAGDVIEEVASCRA